MPFSGTNPISISLWASRAPRACGAAVALAARILSGQIRATAAPTETMEVRQCKQAAIAQLISDVTAIAAGHGLQNIVCVLPEHDDLKRFAGQV